MRRTLRSWLLHLGLITKSRRARRKLRGASVQALEDRVMLHCEVLVDDLTVVEADAATNAVVTVTLNEPQTSAVLVGYSTSAINAEPGVDYEVVAGTLTFAPGVTMLGVTLPITGDLLSEAEERFQLELACETAEHPPHAHIIIEDNDPGPTVSIGDAAAVDEGDSATSSAVFNISLSQASGRPVTVSYATASGTAVADSDYQQARGAIVFEPGETLRHLAVSVNGDVRQEG